MNKSIIISPSGNFYGSEQVLFDYLSHSSIETEVVVPAKSILEEKLRALLPENRIKTYKPHYEKFFYTRLFLKILAGKYNTVYINEAGHVKYILLLSRIFRKINFVVHVRINEDAEAKRWFLKPGKNLTVLTISKNLHDMIIYPSKIIYDPFVFSESESINYVGKVIRVAIIGRVTYTKGSYRLIEILKELKAKSLLEQYRFLIFGGISEDAEIEPWFTGLKQFSQVSLEGFRDNASIYQQADIVMHLSVQEPLGRIFFESINAGIPFVGIKSAGIGEIGGLTGLEELLADPDSPDLINEIIDKLVLVKNNYPYYRKQVTEQKKIAQGVFNIKDYCETIDGLLSK